ncbi:phage holin family protein [Heliorestis acidaminivorans]|uniref:Phage holin family protein n=1 Tax=Heliorestis acidaminivorans TaxID=553427 RepID=A0A6I0EXV3_9FIRM|nr:phage holin family protein [Heliorestis acidaminivorans]KAB2952083.1 phage holin family protein [Heliorestis acidaminivorans]
MNAIIMRWLFNTLALVIAAFIIPGIEVLGIAEAMIAAFLLGVVNAFIRPLVLIFTLPITVLTLGLFALVINGLMLWMVSAIVPGLEIAGFWSAFFGAIILSLVSTLLSWFVKD